MALPLGIDKATGVAAALNALGIPLGDTVGVGDAENDITFLAARGLSVAVDNALPPVKDAVDLVMLTPRGHGARDLIGCLCERRPKN